MSVRRCSVSGQGRQEPARAQGKFFHGGCSLMNLIKLIKPLNVITYIKPEADPGAGGGGGGPLRAATPPFV